MCADCTRVRALMTPDIRLEETDIAYLDDLLAIQKIDSLKNFRLIYPTIESLDKFLNHVQIILNSKKDS